MRASRAFAKSTTLLAVLELVLAMMCGPSKVLHVAVRRSLVLAHLGPSLFVPLIGLLRTERAQPSGAALFLGLLGLVDFLAHPGRATEALQLVALVNRHARDHRYGGNAILERLSAAALSSTAALFFLCFHI